MKYIFEDNVNMAVSKLIIKVFGKENVIFTGTNKQLLREFIKHDDSIVFVDVSPDNKYTVSIYDDLMEHAPSRVYPYPCIEFVILAMLFKQGYEVSKGSSTIYKDIVSGVKVEYSDKSLEKLMKRLLQSSYKKCFHNVNLEESNSSVEGVYYIEDCSCPSMHTKSCISKLTLLDKADLLKEFLDTPWNKDSVELYTNICKSIGCTNPIV